MGKLLLTLVILALVMVFMVGFYTFARVSHPVETATLVEAHATAPVGIRFEEGSGLTVMRPSVSVRWKPVILLVPLLFLALLIALIVLLIRVLGRGSTERRDAQREELEMVRDMYEGFERMGQRIDALEAILIEKSQPRP